MAGESGQPLAHEPFEVQQGLVHGGQQAGGDEEVAHERRGERRSVGVQAFVAVLDSSGCEFGEYGPCSSAGAQHVQRCGRTCRSGEQVHQRL